MTIMLPGRQVSKAGYIFRAIVAMALLLAFALWMISRSTGMFDDTAQVHGEIPVEAGLISPGAPVRYNGVKVGNIDSIEAGTTSSRIGLAVDRSMMKRIPDNVVIRVAPRTFFGDIYIQLRPGTGESTGELRDGADIPVDSGDDAVNLYDVFTKLSTLLGEVKPEKVNVALNVVSRAIGDRGDELGIMIDDWWVASRELESTMNRFLDATPKFRAVVESLRRATPDVIKTLASTTSISRGIVENRDQLVAMMSSAAGYLDSVTPFVAAQRKNLITIIDSTSTIFSTVADNPDGLSTTLAEADKFGAARTILFATCKFNITAVPTFSQPMPYTAADCPHYGNLRGQQCFGTSTRQGVGPVRAPGEPNGTILNPPRGEDESPERMSPERMSPEGISREAVIDGAAENEPLSNLESTVTGKRSSATGTPSPATKLMVGPMVRGMKVQVQER
ncbi:MCE family protein [Gordonia sp. (in: high G+C Gram-positive bacteria)]|uniref:MCE family protein n=1 Tax=Gordonia sp. (in: high G+C Gram-positive bacteria) TaxID=84139 RepID=UPI002D13A58C|nr:MCE family protein [Gordonia sp. (in: high G+C Gram-positive bacteria)]HMS76603.1 MCE family protein [Gordonia sp. (in: high G+C Gram-positive bacteria)]